MVIIQNGHLCSNFVVKSKVYHFEHGRYFQFQPWSWSKWVFLCSNYLAKFKINHLDHYMENLDFGHSHGRNFLINQDGN